MHSMRNEFSRAVGTHSVKMGLLVRPKKKLGEALVLGDVLELKDESIDPEELNGDEARAIPGQKIVYQPTKQEWDGHNRTHFPFRKWCPFCVKGKCRTGAHMRHSKSEEEIEREKQVISTDYMGPKSKFMASLTDQDSDIESLPILIGID